MEKEEQLKAIRDLARERLSKYTRKAFRMLPRMDRPRILDIGCGSGVGTMELARLTRGEVTGIDIDRPALEKFARKIKGARLTDRVQAVYCSMFDMDYADESFDIIWSEGSIYAIGKKLEHISKCGYELLGHFLISQETWWTEYFVPLEKLVTESRTTDADDPEILEEVHQAQEQLAMFRKNPERNNSVCFVMKKN